MVKSRIVNVIETRLGDEISYFTLEGVAIGGFSQGQKVEPQIEKEEIKPQGGVVTAPKPEEVKRQKEMETAKLMDGQERLKNISR